ncbi:MAG: TonB family protein [Acidobacteria bacterium]|nr:TonB family protein [Acidobacteriota bacterium]
MALVTILGTGNRKPKRESSSKIQSGPATSVAVPEPSDFPPQHSSVCDFSAERPARISDWLPRGIVRRAVPSYPAHARSRGIRGTVNVSILIDRNGAVERVCSAGPAELRMAAEAAAVEFRFRRPMLNRTSDPFGLIQETLVFDFVPDDRQH